jgi:hypothetical protein
MPNQSDTPRVMQQPYLRVLVIADGARGAEERLAVFSEDARRYVGLHALPGVRLVYTQGPYWLSSIEVGTQVLTAKQRGAKSANPACAHAAPRQA